MKVAEIIDLVRAHYPTPLSRQEVLDRFGLTGLDQRQTGGLSGGQKRRLAVALAFAGNPQAVFLDEPMLMQLCGLLYDRAVSLAIWKSCQPVWKRPF